MSTIVGRNLTGKYYFKKSGFYFGARYDLMVEVVVHKICEHDMTFDPEIVKYEKATDEDAMKIFNKHRIKLGI